jgi:inosine/xanthosine triphosphatase
VLVAVGSVNPGKVEAVRAAFGQLWPDEAWDVVGVAVPSGVAHQPMTEAETRRGARARAAGAREALDADYGVGLEGGLEPDGDRWLNCGWVHVIARDGTEAVASTLRVVVPARLMALVLAGRELGDACDELFGTRQAKHSQGMLGLLSNGVLDRTTVFSHAVAAALTTFLHPELA